jgi:hypothetical protein
VNGDKQTQHHQGVGQDQRKQQRMRVEVHVVMV